MPRSMMSAVSSGGVRSSATLIALTMVETHSLNAPRISLSSTVTVFGTPQDITLSELAIELFYPGDDATEAVLRGSADNR